MGYYRLVGAALGSAVIGSWCFCCDKFQAHPCSKKACGTRERGTLGRKKTQRENKDNTVIHQTRFFFYLMFSGDPTKIP